MPVPLFSHVPLAIPVETFPHDFLIACTRDMGPSVTIGVPAEAGWDFDSPVTPPFSLNYRGAGCWSLALWAPCSREDRPCYLTGEAISQFRRDGPNAWILRPAVGI